MLKVISLGGSLIVPKEIDHKFLKQFKKIIENYTKKGNKVIIVCGGGHTCRKYYKAAKKITKIKQNQLDWVGVMATRINAELIRVIFNNKVNKKVGYDSKKKYNFKRIQIIGGDKPGGSSDLDAVELAKTHKAAEIVNLTDVSYVYNKNPKQYKNAKPIKKISWKDYKKVIGGKWIPGSHTPFDPIASKKAMQYKLKVIIAKGKDLNNLKKILYNKQKIKATIIY